MKDIDIYADDAPTTLEYKIAVMQAALAGAPVQYRRRDQDRSEWSRSYNPAFGWGLQTYRIDPASRPKTTVPLGPEDIPPVCWLRGGADCYLIRTVSHDSVGFGDPFGRASYEKLMTRGWEYSTDRKTWRPCSKEVDAS